MGFIKNILNIFKSNKVTDLGNLLVNKKDTTTQNLVAIEELQQLVSPLIRNATKLELQKASSPPENSQLISHFGGQPYFEEGDSWPKAQNGNDLDFIFQIFNSDDIQLPKSVKLVQFFYDVETFPWQTEEDGWLVKIYETLNTDRLIKIDNPILQEEKPYCEVLFTQVKSLPDWEGIDLYEKNTLRISSLLNLENDWDGYEIVVEKLIGEQDFQSQLGGYPRWIQGESTPTLSNGENMKLLFQIDSEENADLMWGDVGMVYVFYDEQTKRVDFTLQCH
ncbi:MAG: DUF1963 domain-containing protein [Bacteroidetes bacterium]|uniref:YwqG family protein n=1 Tax=Phnomibacter sp. TaxID=2836217 RepID=UPI002FDED49D|nr:DUF1963 domain-containing protein [Bacteroidota bacterium]